MTDDNVLYPRRFHKLRTIASKLHTHETETGGITSWGEYQVKEGRKIIARFPTLLEAMTRYPTAAVVGLWVDDEPVLKQFRLEHAL